MAEVKIKLTTMSLNVYRAILRQLYYKWEKIKKKRTSKEAKFLYLNW